MELNEIQYFLKENITYLFSYLGAIQGVILAFIVLNYPHQHKTSNRILAVFLFILAYLLVIARISELVENPFFRLVYCLRFFAPIALVLYIQSLYKKINWKKQYWHLLTICLDFLVLFSLIVLKISTIGDDPIWSSFQVGVLSWGWFIFIYLIYFRLIIRSLRAYREKVFRNFSTLHNLGLKWVYQIYYGFLGLIVIDVLVGLFSFNFPNSYSPYHGLVNTITYTIFMYFVTIRGKLNPQIYQLRILESSPLPVSEKEIKYSNKNILEENKELTLLSLQVQKIIKEEKLYKEMGLSVNELADKIGSQTYLVSQAINSCLGKNFYELINRYRVEEAKSLLKDETMNYLSIVGIGFEAGFNSKTAFNTSFKKYTGVTPSEFKKNNT